MASSVGLCSKIIFYFSPIFSQRVIHGICIRNIVNVSQDTDFLHAWHIKSFLPQGFSPPANYTDQPSDRRLSTKLVPTLADKEYRLVMKVLNISLSKLKKKLFWKQNFE
jgi:hypothetical protein